VIEVESERVRKERESKRAELDRYSEAIFDTHKETINSLCKEMGADFEIEDFKPLKKIVGTSERIFAIKFFGSYKVNIENKNESTPNFKNTLSESDKRLLAFAFFLSLLMHDSELNKKIVVFDDPMSSLDNERRRKTIHLLADLMYAHKETNGTVTTLYPVQKIIMTHEDHFAKELKRIMSEACTLKIKGYTEGSDKRSKIVHADFDEDFPDDDISQRIENLKRILDTESFLESFHDDCRIVLEHIFKRKYFLNLKTQIAERKSVRTFTTTLSSDKVGGFEEETKFNRFIRLCDDLNIELHDNDSSSSDGDKKSILEDFFICLSSI